METYNENNTPINGQEENGLSLKDIIGLCLGHWPWFVASVLLCLLIAAYKIITTPPVYTRYASVLIKEERKGRSIGVDISSEFANLGLGVGLVNVNNEIINFSSPDLMLQVVKNLELNTDYFYQAKRYDLTLYGSSLPIKVQFPSLANNAGVELKVNPVDSTTVELTGWKIKGDKVKGDNVIAAFGDTVSTPVGEVCVIPAYLDSPVLERCVVVRRSPYSYAVRRFRAATTATLNGKQSTVIDLNIKDVNVQRADDILNMMINVYNENWIKDKNQITNSTNEFIAERLKVIENELGSVDKTITSFRSSHRLPDVGTAVNMDMQLSVEAGKQLLDLNNQLSIARFLQNDIRNTHPGTLLPANVGLKDNNTQSQITQYNSLMLQRNRLVESSSEENLLVKDMDQQMSALRSTILTGLGNYIQALNIQIQSTQVSQSRSQARVSDIPVQAGEILSDERQQKVKEALYLFLLQKREENELSQAFTAYNTRVITSPNGPVVPISPKKKMILLVAFLLGLAIPFAWFYLKEVLNTTIRGRKDLENLKAPFLGELPVYGTTNKKILRLIKKGNQKEAQEQNQILVKPHSRNVINEAFRVVRTNLEFMRGRDKEEATVMMITSFNVGSGKTFCSINLSTALAVKGRKVLVIDCDLRKRTVSKFANQPKTGLSNYLNGRVADAHELIVHNVGGNDLDLLPVGIMPPNPAELLGEPRRCEKNMTMSSWTARPLRL